MTFQTLTLLTKKPPVKTTGKRASLTHMEYGIVDQSNDAIPFTLITVASPARATREFPFDLQLQGPFDTVVRTRLTPVPCSLRRRFSGYSSSSRPFVFKLTFYIRLFFCCQGFHEK